MKNIMIGFLGLLLFTGVAHAQSQIHDVSMIQLVASPEKYEGKYVRVMGFLRLKFEGNGLYLHREDYEKSLYKNGVWVHVAETEANRKFNMKYVLIEGTFDSKDKGHMGLWSGAIKDIKRIDFWGADRDEKTTSNQPSDRTR
ncbi:MAG: hypothetical protein NT011_05835 [Kiritimatiellaeota bacterium]|nr:hypothetical protein [Kiritimatiellota bacterium]